ncbi:GNAT family N-acetyltransferase [Paenibacillus aestuarii]|uniref:Enhanced intracellular survival protein Eis n=1 Tax=Paenibacillus aestuarii TaxID=516965 RepID=A0ABW0KE53_9BACL|nr:GNAT family N-acetyltransferase [Paenibacillus aestuarii]
MNEIRTLVKEEFYESTILSEFAFQYELTAEERAERLEGNDNNQVLGYFIDGSLAAKLIIIPLSTWLNGKQFAMGGIAGVATWPEYRRNGMVGQLLGQTLRMMKEAGQTVSFLHPFKFEFYRKFGWETYIEYLKYEIPVDKLPRFQAPEGSSVRRIEKNWELLNPLYEAHAQRYNGMLVRDEAWWNQRYFKSKKGITAIYRDTQGEPKGYVFYQVKERVMTIHEFVYLDEEARRGLWKFLGDHDSMINKVEMNAPKDDELAFLVPDPRFKQEVIPYFSARIVDVAEFVNTYPFAARERAEAIYLKVSDAHAEWNEGVFRLDFTGNGTSAQALKLAEEEIPSGASVVSGSIQALSALLIGYQKAGFLARIGRLQGMPEAIARLEAAIPERVTYLADFF